MVLQHLHQDNFQQNLALESVAVFADNFQQNLQKRSRPWPEKKGYEQVKKSVPNLWPPIMHAALRSNMQYAL